MEGAPGQVPRKTVRNPWNFPHGSTHVDRLNEVNDKIYLPYRSTWAGCNGQSLGPLTSAPKDGPSIYFPSSTAPAHEVLKWF